MEYFAFLNSPWFQMLAPVASAFLAYRFPKQSAGVVNILSLVLNLLKAPEAPKPPQA
jgi:hypothetical protein